MTSVTDYDYDLPPALIAQEPADRRDASRLLVFDRATGSPTHARFIDLPGLLRAGDVVVLNDSRVIPARLRGSKAGSTGQIETLLIDEVGTNDWWAMVRPGKRVRPGSRLVFPSSSTSLPSASATVLEKNSEGHCRLRFEGPEDIRDVLERIGEIPLPPYIERSRTGAMPADRERYQTVYAAHPGSVAAPTAGLHFTPETLQALRDRGVTVVTLALHVGIGTFAPVKSDTLEGHRMHAERYHVPAATADAVNAALDQGRRVVAIGTTVVRVLEHLAAHHRGRIVPGPGSTDIFIHPPRDFRVVGALLTNFHLPRSTLLMLVSAFAGPGTDLGRNAILRAYHEAVQHRYRFFSYGDAMFIH